MKHSIGGFVQGVAVLDMRICRMGRLGANEAGEIGQHGAQCNLDPSRIERGNGDVRVEIHDGCRSYGPIDWPKLPLFIPCKA